MAKQDTVKASESIDFDVIKNLTSEEAKAVDQLIVNELSSDVLLINQMSHYIIGSGGKRLRPMLLLLAAKALGKFNDNHLVLAAVIEFIHTATLLHDDVVDESQERRGKKTANLVFGNQETVLVGDFLFSKSFQLMVKTKSIDILNILSNASAIIAEGEVLQLQHKGSLSINWDIYKNIIGAKTASLFAASCEVSGSLIKNSTAQNLLKEYGYNLGMTFQITDDILDYDADQNDLGKSIGDDFREGKITAPVLFALENATDEEKKFWERTIVNQEIDNTGKDLHQAQNIIKKHNALGSSKDMAKEYARKAEDSLKDLLKLSSLQQIDKKLLETMIELPHSIISRLY
jgi:octaprenyl-diphosphate synthase